MGKIADIITSPEWAGKTPLEKAQARRDLFALTLEEHPEIKDVFTKADGAGKQRLVDQFKEKIEKDFPDAFAANGYKIEIGPKGERATYGGFNRIATENGAVEGDKWQGPRTPVYDVATEQILVSAADPANKAKFAELPEEQRHAIAPFLYERFGPDRVDAELFGKPEDFIDRNESGATKAAKFAIPALFRLGPPLLASVTRNPRAVALAAGAGDAAAQSIEKAMGARQSFSAAEMGLNTVLAAIPAATIGKFANPALNMAARVGVRAAEGAAQGTAFEGVRQMVEGEEFDAGRVGMVAAFGAGLGSIIGGFEPKIAALLSGKSADDALATLKTAAEKATPAEREALTAAQRRIEEMLNVNAAKKDAAESAAALSAEHPPVVKSARESAETMAPELAANERRSADFDRAQAEEAGQTIKGRQIAGDETIMLGDDAAKNQQSGLDTRPGEAAAERAKLDADIQSRTPKVDDGSVPDGVQMSPQAQAIYDQHGFISPKLAASLAGGASGFATGVAQDPEGETGQERAVNRIQRGLVMAVAGAAGGYMLGRHFTNPAPRTKAPSGSVLAQVDKHLQPASTPSLKARIAAVPTQLRGALVTRFAALDTLARNVGKANPDANLPELPLSRKFEQIAGANGKAAQDVRDFEEAVVRNLAPTERHDFDRLLFLKRTGQRLQWNAWLAGEKARITAISPGNRTPDEVRLLARDQDKSVADWTLVDVDAGLAELEQRLGQSKTTRTVNGQAVPVSRFAELDQLAAGEFQQSMDRGLQLQVASGRISPAAYAAIKASNDFYAPFRVLSAIEGHDGAAAVATGGAAIDTRKQVVRAIEGISDVDFRLESPTVAAAENLARGRILADKNLKMLELARVAEADTAGQYIRKLGPGQDPRRGFETVNYFDQGEPMRLEVSPDVAKAIKGLNPAETGVIADLIRRSGAMFRFGATGANAAFQVANLFFADQPRLALMSKYGVRPDPREFLQMPTDFVHAMYSSVMGNIAGKETALYRRFYESGAAGATFQDAIDRISGRVGETALMRSAKGFTGVIDDVSAVARAVEETTKLMGFRRGLRLEGIDQMPPGQAAQKLEEIVTEVRNFTGSPDFARHGTVARDANMMIVFFNARLQGTFSDVGRLFGTDGARTAAGAWARLGTAVGLPTAYFWYRNQQPENKVDFDRLPEWERQSYLMIPRYGADGAPLYSTNPQGEKVREYWRLQKREGPKIMANLVESALQFASKEEPEGVVEFGVRLLEDASPINIAGKTGTERIESAISNLTPALRLLYEVPANRDAFRHRDIVPASKQGGSDPTEQQFPGRTPSGYIAAAKAAPTFLWDPLRSPLTLMHITEGMTGGLVRQFTPAQRRGDREPTAEALASNPLTRRFVGSLQVGHDENLRMAEQGLKQSRDRTIALDNAAIRELDGLASMAPKQKEARLREIDQAQPELLDAMSDEADARAKNLTQPDRLARRMPVRDGTRARYIAERFTRLPADKREAFLRDQAAKGILTDEVLEHLILLMRGGGRS